MSYIRLEKDADGIVELIFDQQGKSVNVKINLKPFAIYNDRLIYRFFHFS